MKNGPPKAPENSAARILVIDDEVDMLTNYKRLFHRVGHECLALENARQLETVLDDFAPDLVLTDLVLGEGSGMEVLDRVNSHDPNLPVILVTARGSIDNAVEAMKHRAADYLTKPFSVEDLLGKIQQALSNRLIARMGLSRSAGAESADWRAGIIGISAHIERVLEMARKVSRTDVNVLVVGESGTGKEVFARAIHRLSSRRKEIFVPVDCASLPENLLESELFGYRKGAFTGAGADKMGLFEFAHKGTLFLDEIGEMPVALQSKLLRVLQERRFRPIGGRKEIHIDVRVVAATNRDLEKALREKTLRSDLYYRLNVVTIALPALRERAEDIPLLADYFLRQFIRDSARRLDGFSPAALEALKTHDWPGNVRELQNVVERAATLAPGPLIEIRDLPETLAAPLSTAVEDRSLFATKGKMIVGFERDYLVSLLVSHHFNISRAARTANCSRRTLYRMIQRHDLDLRSLRKRRHPHQEPSE